MQVRQFKTPSSPGVYIPKDILSASNVEVRTGVPLFIGFTEKGDPDEKGASRFRMTEIAGWPDFIGEFGFFLKDHYLAYAVRGFFSNGGNFCYVTGIAPHKEANFSAELDRVLSDISDLPELDEIDLVCMPDIPANLGMEQAVAMQDLILKFCRCDFRGGNGDELKNHRNCFAILDSLPGSNYDTVRKQRSLLTGEYGALYFPWIKLADGPAATNGFVPPCGHVAGIYARSDLQTGIHKAPANEVIEEALDLAVNLTTAAQDLLNPENINCLRSFPGRGIRVWGARTLSRDPAWLYVNVRRLFLTVCRWVEKTMSALVFEPNDARLWMRVTREVNSYLNELYRKGAFQGGTVEEAFYVKCDAETNPQEVRDQGWLVAEIGLAAAIPGEFIIVRIIQTEAGSKIAAGSAPAPTPSPAPGPAETSTAKIVIVRIEANPPGADVGGEYILLRNEDTRPVEMTNWLLTDLAGHEYVFPGFTLQSGAEVRIWTKAGNDTGTDLHFGHGWAIWNNTGDKATLYDSQKHLVATFEYGETP